MMTQHTMTQHNNTTQQQHSAQTSGTESASWLTRTGRFLLQQVPSTSALPPEAMHVLGVLHVGSPQPGSHTQLPPDTEQLPWPEQGTNPVLLAACTVSHEGAHSEQKPQEMNAAGRGIPCDRHTSLGSSAAVSTSTQVTVRN